MIGDGSGGGEKKDGDVGAIKLMGLLLEWHDLSFKTIELKGY